MLEPIKERFNAGDATNSMKASLLKESFSLGLVWVTFTVVVSTILDLLTAGDVVRDQRQIKISAKCWMVLSSMSTVVLGTAAV